MSLAKRQLENKRNRRTKKNLFPGHRWPIDVTIEGDTGITQQWQRQQDTKAVKQFNTKIRAWGQKVDTALRGSISQHINNDNKLSGSLKQNFRHYGKAPQSGQEITSIGFSFKEEGLFVHLGVGRGYNMESGTRIITKKSDSEWRRHPKTWFNPVIERHIPELVNIVQEYCGELIVNTMKIYIDR